MFIVWDYFRDHFARGAGMRLDHFLLSPARLRTAGVDRFVRAQDTASDHPLPGSSSNEAGSAHGRSTYALTGSERLPPIMRRC